MAKEEAKPQDKKGGGWFGWLKPKPAEQAIAALASDLNVSVDVTDKGKVRLTLSSDSRSTISSLVKALRRENVDIPEGYLPRSITFHEKDNIDEVTAILDKIVSKPKSVKFPELKDRVSEADMAGLENKDLYALRNQNGIVSMNMVGSIVKLALRDKTDAMEASKRRSEEPESDPRAQRKAARKAVPQAGAAVVETVPSSRAATEADFIPDDSIDLGAQYNVISRNGPQGSLVVSHESFTSPEAWLADLKELRDAVGNTGVVTVQRYENTKTNTRGFIIKGLPADQLVEAGINMTTKDDLIRNIQAAAQAEEQYVTTGTEGPVKSATFLFPKGDKQLPLERQQAFIAQLQEAFGDDGHKYVTATTNPETHEQTGFKIIGTTKAELTAGGGAPISNNAMIAKLREQAERIRTETPIADTPDISKSVVMLFPKDLPQERRDSYIEELRSMYPESGDKFVRVYNAKNDINISGIKILGTSKEELLETDRKKIGNKELVAKLQSVISSSRASVVNADAVEPPAGTLALDGTSAAADLVTEFLKETRLKNGEYTVRKKEILANKGVDPTEALRELAESRNNGMSFPEDSKIFVISNIDKDPDQLQALREAFQQEGYQNTAVIGGNNLYVGLTDEHAASHVARLSGESKGAEAEANLRKLLERAFTGVEVEAVVKSYTQRNPVSTGMARSAVGSSSSSSATS